VIGVSQRSRRVDPPLWLRLAFYLIAAAFMASPVFVYFYPELFA
jgi:hypothetical protein